MDGTLMCELFPAYFEWLMFTERALNDPAYTAPDAVRQEARRVLAAIEMGNKFPYDKLALKSNRSRNELICMAMKYALDNLKFVECDVDK